MMCKSSIEGVPCDRLATSMGWCQSHYARNRLGIPMDQVRRDYAVVGCQGTVLGVSCDRPHFTKGLCEGHNERFKKGTDLDAGWDEHHGFNPSLPSVLYLLDTAFDGVMKVGIMRATSDRMRHHFDAGHSLFASWNFDTGAEAVELEQVIKKKFCKGGVISKELMPNGYTETFQSVDVDDVVALISTRRSCDES